MHCSLKEYSNMITIYSAISLPSAFITYINIIKLTPNTLFLQCQVKKTQEGLKGTLERLIVSQHHITNFNARTTSCINIKIQISWECSSLSL